MKAINKRIFLIFLYTSLLVSYLLGFLVVFNLKDVIGIGHYYGQEDFTINLDGTTCGLNVEMYAYHHSSYEHYYGYTLTPFSNGEVELEGITYLSYRVATATALKQILDTNYSVPILFHSVDDFTRLYQNDNLTIHGYANITFKINDVFETHKISIDYGIIIELDGDVLNYEWGNISTWLNVIYLSFTVIPIMLLYRSIKYIKFDTWYNKELEIRDTEFFNRLGKKKNHQNDFI